MRCTRALVPIVALGGLAMGAGGCGGEARKEAQAPSNRPEPEATTAETAADEAANAPADEAAGKEPGRCYPYLPREDGSCRTACASRDECAGSRGPADFAENGWPLDCIQSKCVPLPPEHVHGRP